LKIFFKKFREFGLEFLKFDVSSAKGLGDKLKKQKNPW